MSESEPSFNGESISQVPKESLPAEKEKIPHLERQRLIVHLARVFSRRYDLQVLPSGKKGLWACGLDPKISPEIDKYIRGQRETLDDLPADSFVPRQILYDEQTAQEMRMEEITTLLRHEAGHAKYTDFRLMFEGQRHAKDEGHLPTSFWLTFEGTEDPRVNVLEGEESPAIDRMIRKNQGNELQKRITEAPLTKKPLLLQFAYNSFHYWLHGEGIPELQGTEVGRLGELAKPFLQLYFQNTDVEQRRALQEQIWDIAKGLEKQEVEKEEIQQMANKKQGQQGQGQSGEVQSGDSQSSGEQGERSKQTAPEGKGQKGFLNKLRENLLGKKNEPVSKAKEQPEEPKGNNQPQEKPEQPEVDLSKLSEEEMQEIKEAIEKLSPEEKAELVKKARKAVDEAQMKELEKKLSKAMKLKKNEKTGEYEAVPQIADEKLQEKAKENLQEASRKVEAEEKVEQERQEVERKRQEEMVREMERQRQEKLEMEKAGFSEDEREKFLLYQELESSIYSSVRNFMQAIEKVIPRKKKPIYESGYFNGPKFSRRDLIRKAPVGDERFHMRQVERPIGEPRLFIGLLVDNSGSMSGKKMEEARRTMIFFAKVCREMGIPFMAAAFGDRAEPIKSFRQDFDNPSERIKPKIIEATDSSGGSTNLYDGIELTIGAMNEQRRRLSDSHGIIFVITDGGANAGLTGESLRRYIEENRGRLTFKAFGLSGSKNEQDSIKANLNTYFGEGNCAYPNGFADLPDEAFRVLRVNLMQFQKYFA